MCDDLADEHALEDRGEAEVRGFGRLPIVTQPIEMPGRAPGFRACTRAPVTSG